LKTPQTSSLKSSWGRRDSWRCITNRPPGVVSRDGDRSRSCGERPGAAVLISRIAAEISWWHEAGAHCQDHGRTTEAY
jgi:hypothetical protein